MSQMAYSGSVGRLRTGNAPVCWQKAVVPDFGQFTKRGSDAPLKLLEKFGRGRYQRVETRGAFHSQDPRPTSAAHEAHWRASL
jgi:hypothetical protein